MGKTMDLTTTYMGLKLQNPVVPSACGPLTNSISQIKAMEDAGAGAIVLYSLFEEEIISESQELDHYLSNGAESFAEALTYFPEAEKYHVGPDDYLEHIRKAKEAVRVPVIGSLNGVSTGGWIDIAKKIEQAGADALELNIYYIPAGTDMTGQAVEQQYLDVLTDVKKHVKIPVAVKTGGFFSATGNMAKRFCDAGANGLVMFNRFYQPDIDLENLEVSPNVLLSTPQAMRLPMRWIAVLHGRINCSLAATSGIHTGEDVIKMLMVGADCTMVCSALLKNGIGHIGSMLREMKSWMEANEYASVAQMKGSLSQKSCPDPTAFERANYMKAVKSYV
jgi:dihydroorotate dehydrogenase (fumarate)